MVTGSGFGASRLPQNLRSGQRVENHPNILGVPRGARHNRRGGSASPSRVTGRWPPILFFEDYKLITPNLKLNKEISGLGSSNLWPKNHLRAAEKGNCSSGGFVRNHGVPHLYGPSEVLQLCLAGNRAPTHGTKEVRLEFNRRK